MYNYIQIGVCKINSTKILDTYTHIHIHIYIYIYIEKVHSQKNSDIFPASFRHLVSSSNFSYTVLKQFYIARLIYPELQQHSCPEKVYIIT